MHEPTGLAPGQYDLYVGLYDPLTRGYANIPFGLIDLPFLVVADLLGINGPRPLTGLVQELALQPVSQALFILSKAA